MNQTMTSPSPGQLLEQAESQPEGRRRGPSPLPDTRRPSVRHGRSRPHTDPGERPDHPARTGAPGHHRTDPIGRTTSAGSTRTATTTRSSNSCRPRSPSSTPPRRSRPRPLSLTLLCWSPTPITLRRASCSSSTLPDEARAVADQAILHAQRSENPIAIGAASRIVTHALMAEGDTAAAIDFASTEANCARRLDEHALTRLALDLRSAAAPRSCSSGAGWVTPTQRERCSTKPNEPPST